MVASRSGRAVLLLAVVAGCRASPVAQPTGDARAFHTLETFQGSYWDRPLPPQGNAGTRWADSLAPSRCGSCHPIQFADWRTSLHAHAFSPGLEGQLVTWVEDDYGTVRECLACHAPLAEQSERWPLEGGAVFGRNPGFDRGLQHEGLTCGACHLRGGQAHGPPRRDGSVGRPDSALPHRGVQRSPFFTGADFCGACHQFEAPAPNGKPLENTVREWSESRYAAQGVSCQGCHMPDRRHLWRGIHDSAMTAGGVRITLTRTGSRATLRIVSTGVGHAFPTYATPRVDLILEQLDERGTVPSGGVTRASLGREVKFDGQDWVEVADTRVAPDSAALLVARIAPGTRTVRARVEVVPDALYESLYADLLSAPREARSRELIEAAAAGAARRRYLLYADSLILP